MEKRQSILREAESLVNGARQKAYGKPQDNFKHISDVVSALFRKKVTAREVVLILIVMKLCRHQHSPKRDNNVDAAGYLEILSRIEYDNIKYGREIGE